MKNIQLILFIVSFAIGGMSCGEHSSSSTKKDADGTQVATHPAKAHPIESLIKTIDSATKDMTPKEFEMDVKEDHACDIKDYGQKKHVFCFAGGLKANEVLAYYSKDGQIKAAIFTTEYYNASPANVAAFDESKTIKKQVKLYFKDGSFHTFDKVLDMNGKEITMTEDQTTDWNIMTEAIPPL